MDSLGSAALAISVAVSRQLACALSPLAAWGDGQATDQHQAPSVMCVVASVLSPSVCLPYQRRATKQRSFAVQLCPGKLNKANFKYPGYRSFFARSASAVPRLSLLRHITNR
ncbi:hypothetical protein LMH87_001092 [Akanthomyces muscarius]|uniref:Uncharacterized protein n=1 Tax=Akanthomyces muscarius TaxID=2231603 RepID=A0A9W8QI54_AKAMU|nr:hypothetical protein LMH87_001092 [Akanthomyces muscarius]KAJ4155867.1 hypothetical protein LMH87_001092 [Akanthomyces muscarius]